MPSKQRYVVIGTLVLAAVVGLALAHGLAWLGQQAGLTEPLVFGSRDLPLSTVAGFGLAIVGALLLLKNERSHALASEIVDELSRVSWPSRQETGNATVVVIVAVVVCSAYLGIFDAVWLWVTDLILGVPKISG